MECRFINRQFGSLQRQDPRYRNNHKHGLILRLEGEKMEDPKLK